jgi:16S rRNA (cytosine1402-N4)-methyltransferase
MTTPIEIKFAYELLVAHIPVLSSEVLAGLDPQPGQTVVDATAGAGGHTALLWQRIAPTGTLIAIDQDPTMLAIAQARLSEPRIRWLHGSFEDLPALLQAAGVDAADAILADLGFCSDQLADPQRGLSFQLDGPLDMRLDQTRGEPASALLRRSSEKDLADVFWRFGEERFSRRVAKQIVETRKAAPITTTRELAELVRRCVPRAHGHNIDPATRVFQALRIAVNDELGALERFLQITPDCLKPGGRIAIISFHSLEDRLVKQAFRKSPELIKEVTRKPLRATDQEIQDNPRARSAKLRVARKEGVGNRE